jgi:energy-coupling factor transporter transmembrane protein EcfT
MRIAKRFVKAFFILLAVVILINIVALIFDFWSYWIGGALVIFGILFLFLFFRKKKEGGLRILAWILPLLIVGFFIYINFLPFGYSREYELSVSEGVILGNGIYLEDSRGRVISDISDAYSKGVFYAVISPKAVLKDALVTVEIQGDDVYLAEIDFLAEENDWDYFWDFSEGIPRPLEGAGVFREDLGCAYLNGSNNETLFYPNSSRMFENNSFVTYVRWRPEDLTGVSQQIMGHYLWDFFLSNDSFRFSVGRMIDRDGPRYTLRYDINESFFNEEHYALGIYKRDDDGRGFVELWVDGNFAGRTNIGNMSLWEDYNGNRNMSFGWSPHNYGMNDYFTGCVYSAGFSFQEVGYHRATSFRTNEKTIKIPIMGGGSLDSVKVIVKK